MTTGHAHLRTYSIELTPKSLARLPDLRQILPLGTRVYLAHIAGTDFETLLKAARRVIDEGYAAMPHLPVRLLPDKASLERWVGRYRDEAGVRGALVIAGGMAQPLGPYADSLTVLRSGVFERHGYTHLHLAAHPEGHPQMDPDGRSMHADAVLLAKQQYAGHTDAQLALVTQFGFDARALARWCQRIESLGVQLPVHAGVAGPTQLGTLMRYALQCGVGPSLQVLQQRGRDLRLLLRPFEPTELIEAMNKAVAQGQAGRWCQWHVFALGGATQAAQWFNQTLGLEAAHDSRTRTQTPDGQGRVQTLNQG
jgi:methylenetetrahydrofolate reductase (NADPH)